MPSTSVIGLYGQIPQKPAIVDIHAAWRHGASESLYGRPVRAGERCSGDRGPNGLQPNLPRADSNQLLNYRLRGGFRYHHADTLLG